MSFTLADLLDGSIHYVQSHHLKVEPTKDHFVFYVTDGVNQSPSYSLNISIKVTLFITQELDYGCVLMPMLKVC